MNERLVTQVIPAIVLVVSVVLEVVLGPLVLGVITYHISRDGNAQYIGGELVTLAAAAVLVWGTFRASDVRGHLLAAGAAFYLLYTMLSVVVGQGYLTYEGNAQKWFALFVLITTSSVFLGVHAVSRVLRAGGFPDRRAVRITLVVIGALFAIMWISAIMKNWNTTSAEYLADPVLFWLIKYLDLAIVVPAAITTGAVWTGSLRTAGMLVIAFAFWMIAAICGMQIAMVRLTSVGANALIVAAVMAGVALWCGRLLLTTEMPRP